MTPRRTTLVPPDRLPGWLDRFAAAHGPVVAQGYDDGLRLTAADGTTAAVQLDEVQPQPAVAALLAEWAVQPSQAAGQPPPAGQPSPPADRPGALFAQLAELTRLDEPAGVVLLRRGGYALGVAEAGRLTASKTGTRYVQGRTAAGGWSQQRFARRRTEQAEALLGTVAEQVHRVIGPAAVRMMAFGGDRLLCAELAAMAPLAQLKELPRLPFLDVPDPRLKVLQQAVRQLNAVRIDVTDG